MRSRLVLILIAVFALLILIFIPLGYYRTEFTKKPIVQQKLQEGDVDSLIKFYVSSTPDIVGRPYYGSEEAPITIIIYSDMSSQATQFFFEELLPQLENDFINDGKVKIYYKYYLSIDDMDTKSESFIYAKSLDCLYKIGDNDYYYYLKMLINLSGIDKVPELIVAQGIDPEEYSNCIDSAPDHTLMQDISEVENFGMVGINPRLYIGTVGTDNTIFDGLPSYTLIRQMIRNKQIILGE